MTTLLLLVTTIVCLAALGRIVIPRAERLPWWTWTWQDLTANVARGARVLAKSNEGQRRLWELYHHQLQPRHRRPGHPEDFTRHGDIQDGDPRPHWP